MKVWLTSKSRGDRGGTGKRKREEGEQGKKERRESMVRETSEEKGAIEKYIYEKKE